MKVRPRAKKKMPKSTFKKIVNEKDFKVFQDASGKRVSVFRNVFTSKGGRTFFLKDKKTALTRARRQMGFKL